MSWIFATFLWREIRRKRLDFSRLLHMFINLRFFFFFLFLWLGFQIKFWLTSGNFGSFSSIFTVWVCIFMFLWSRKCGRADARFVNTDLYNYFVMSFHTGLFCGSLLFSLSILRYGCLSIIFQLLKLKITRWFSDFLENTYI